MIGENENLNTSPANQEEMCELKTILVDGERRETLMENTIRIRITGERIELTDILGERKITDGKIKEINITRQEAIIVKE